MALLTVLLSVSACKKNLEIPYPNNSLNTESAFLTMGSVEGMMSQFYSYFNSNAANNSLINRYLPGYSDEGYNPTAIVPFSDIQSNYTIAGSSLPLDWTAMYQSIYWANTLLEGIPGSTAPGFTNDKKTAYMAAIKTMRAWGYFQLVRNYGDVPLITNADVPTNSLKPRDPAASVYAFIEKELQDAVAALPATLGANYFVNNKYIPEAVLAEVYLTEGKWALAEAAASDIIGSNKYQLAASVNDVFIQTSPETIYATPPVYTESNADISFKVGTINFAILFPEGFLRTTLESQSLAISPSLLSSFEAGDLRLANWITLRNQNNYPNSNNRMFAYKYKYSSVLYPGTIPAGREEDNKAIRLATMYLLRAEAKAQQGTDLSGAAADLNMVRNRAGLGNTTATTQTSLIDAVLIERLHELFFEQGYRWYDLVRTKKANAVLSAISYKTNWKPYMTLFPIPPAVLNNSINLKQTPGYF